MSVNNTPFSCLMSCYYKDPVGLMKEALDSICNQTKVPDELVLVEDGELTAEHYDLIGEYEEKLNIKRVKIQKNKGLGNALNKGLEVCENDLVLRMDADDICCPTRFQKQVDFMCLNKAVDILGSWAHVINEQGNIIGERLAPIKHGEIYNIIWSNPIIHPAVAYRKSSIMSIGSYDRRIVRRQDYDLWFRAAKEGLIFENIPEHLLFYRFTDDYFKKNNFKVVWGQAMMGIRGLKNLEDKLPFYTYLFVCFPIFRTLVPSFMKRPINNMIRFFDPRKKVVVSNEK